MFTFSIYKRMRGVNVLVIDDKNNIQLTRGDTARFEIDIVNMIDNSAYTIADDDILRFSVKRSTNDKDFVIHKELQGQNIVYINPDDTNSLSFGKYVYDVEVTTSNGDVYTVIPPSKFTLTPEVTWQ